MRGALKGSKILVTGGVDNVFSFRVDFSILARFGTHYSCFLPVHHLFERLSELFQ